MADLLEVVRGRLASALGFTHGGKRDLYEVFGYPPVLTVENFILMYTRSGIATRIIRAFSQATWRDPFVVYDDAGSSSDPKSKDYSPFVEAVENLFEKFNVNSVLERVDRLSSLGRYGVLFVGFRDGGRNDQPVTRAPLLFLQPYVESGVNITQYETDVKNERFGKPILYSLSPTSLLDGSNTVMRQSVSAHWSRCIHVVEWLDQDEVYGLPRLQPIYNYLVDLEKVVGGSAETFWLNAREGLSLTADPDANITDTQLKEMKKQAEEYQHQLRRIFALQGISVDTLQAEVADLSPNVDKLLDLIAGTVGIPKRILIGSERGELSSDQDENNWAARIAERRVGYAAPRILKPLIQLLVDTGNLPEPQGMWGVEWPDEAQTPEKEANIASVKSTILNNYLSIPGADLIVPVEEFRSKFLQLDPMPPEGSMVDDLDPQLNEDILEDDEGVGPENPEERTEEKSQDFSALGSIPVNRLPPKLRRNILQKFDVRSMEIPGRKRLFITNAAPKTLYVFRPLLNAKEIILWAKQQGFNTTLRPEDMHVTITFSKVPIDWMKIREAVDQDETGRLIVPPGGPRNIETYQPSEATCLQFNSNGLSWRHLDILSCGATWDHAIYQPHVTLTYNLGDLDLIEIEPYKGELIFGPEHFREIKSDWKNGFHENMGEIAT